ncbi:ATP-binding protein [Sulfurimonas sp.]|uniref:PAS domain-containing sensor histidine kinase n=1 Tax=Sulfurimonas sp. TaxID=2022749 RepID=UPI00356913FD
MKKLRHKEILENISDWLWEVDSSGVYTYCGENVYNFLGFHADKVVGKTPFDFMSEEEAIRVKEKFAAYVEKKENIVNLENTHTHKDGHEVTVLTSAIPILDKNGALLGYQGIDKDITDIREVEKSLKENQKMLAQQTRMAQMGEMISMIAHQWRQPLGAISSAAIDLQIKMELEFFDLTTEEGREEYTEYFFHKIKDINEYVQNLTATIDDFRNFYKPNKESVWVKLDEVISKSLNIIQASLLNDNIKIIKNYKSTIDIELYSNEMMQVILNILKNAQDNFNEKDIENRYIKITTKDKTISICDNGGGIEEDIIDKIFNPYFSTKDEKSGTGLGLYMAKTIIEKHHAGNITVKNTDDGICFIIELGDICI